MGASVGSVSFATFVNSRPVKEGFLRTPDVSVEATVLGGPAGRQAMPFSKLRV